MQEFLSSAQGQLGLPPGDGDDCKTAFVAWMKKVHA